MLNRLTEKIMLAESAKKYEQAVKELSEYLYSSGRADEAHKLADIATLRKNRFSKREEVQDFAIVKKAVVDYCRSIQSRDEKTSQDNIYSMLINFSLFCRNLYLSKIHEKCSEKVKEHLSGFCIENEYDLQKIMHAVMSVVYPDARTESVQDSGHHAIRKDIVIDYNLR